MKTLRLLCIVVAAAGPLLLPISAFPQGSLNPPGPPAPTMKKLDEVEPRTNLQATPAPAGVDTTSASYNFIINQPGSYYLSANVLVTKTNGIQINAQGVTLDLNGFQISQVSPNGIGIEILMTSDHTTVRNGSIKGFASGIFGRTAKACAFRDLAVTACTSYGILTGPSAVLESCRAHDNAGYAAIFADVGSSLVNCTASNNGNTPDSIGIQTARGCTTTHSTAFANSGVGILGGEGSVVKDCVAYSNGGVGIQGQNGCTIAGSSAQYNSATGITTGDHSTVSNCNVSNNNVGGIFVFDASIIAGCTISANHGDGIRCNSANTIEHNAININGVTGTGDGIHSVGFGNRIDSNDVRFNAAAGIRLPNNAHNVVIRNTLGSNTGGNYLVGTGNGVGPIISADAGNVGNATNSPFANIQE
jgi:parallel beta-helix repeat protein